MSVSDEANKTAEDGSQDAGAEGSRPAVSTDSTSADLISTETASQAATAVDEPLAENTLSDDAPNDIEGDDEPEEDTRTDEELAKVRQASLKGIVVKSTAGDDAESEKPDPSKRKWYILKVQSNRETSITEALMRRVKIEGMEAYFGDIIVPTEKVSEFKAGKKRVVKRKLYPGYIVVHMQITDDSWFLVRETPGIGDFTGAAGKPTAMLDHEIAKIIELDKPEEEQPEKLNIRFKVGDRVKINDGTFESFEGDVDAIDEASGRVTVMINIFGRSTPVELEHWQIESL